MPYSEFTPIKFGYIKSEFQKLYDQFIKGARLAIDLSSYIYQNLDRSNKTEYIDDVTYIKNVLNTAKKVFSRDIFYIKTAYTLTETHKQLIVRYVNLCHTNKDKLIVINDVIVYRTENFYGYDDLSILVYIDKTIKFNNKIRKKDLVKLKQQRKDDRVVSFVYQ